MKVEPLVCVLNYDCAILVFELRARFRFEDDRTVFAVFRTAAIVVGDCNITLATQPGKLTTIVWAKYRG